MKLCQVIALLLLMQGEILLADSSANSDADSRIAVGRYVAGGVVGTTLGLGIGHAMQGRYWRDYGWAFTAGEIITFLGAATAGGGHHHPPQCADPHSTQCKEDSDSKEEENLSNWAISFFLVKAAETVAVWWPRNVNFKTIDAKNHAVDSSLIPITQQKFLLGGLLGTVVGFGTGHAIQGRWRREGWKHTAWQAGAAALTAYGWFCSNYSASGHQIEPEPGSEPPKDKPAYPACDAYRLMLLVGVPLWAALKIVEIASVWGPSPDHYRIVTTKHQSPSLAIAPLLNTKQVGVQLVLRI